MFSWCYWDNLRVPDTLGRFSAIFCKGGHFCISIFVFFFCTSIPFWKEEKEFSPKLGKFFSYRVILFSEGRRKLFWQLSPLKMYLLLWKHSSHVISAVWYSLKTLSKKHQRDELKIGAGQIEFDFRILIHLLFGRIHYKNHKKFCR